MHSMNSVASSAFDGVIAAFTGTAILGAASYMRRRVTRRQAANHLQLVFTEADGQYESNGSFPVRRVPRSFPGIFWQKKPAFHCQGLKTRVTDD